MFALLVLAACKNDSQITANPIDSVAVTTGDFDYVAMPLDRLVIPHESYEGLISVATWDRTYDPAVVQLKVETLLGSPDEMGVHGAIFVASGTRGLGLQEYNGLDPDDALVADPAVRDNVRAYVEDGGVLVATDWAYDLVVAVWPEAFTPVGDGTYDAGQRGLNGTVQGRVLDPILQQALGEDVIALEFNYSNWAVLQAVQAGATVHVEGDVSYQGTVDEGVKDLVSAPLLVSYVPAGARGKVVFSSFHFDVQTAEVMDTILTTVVGSFEESASTSLTVARGVGP